eukprot:662173-Alexandrium_andersonii.AAC.1
MGAKRRRPSLLPGCRTLLKQLFAGAMGLSLLASTYGHAVGRPMDYEVTGWDGNTKVGAKLLRSDLAAEDPVLLTTSFPCSP